MRTLTIQQKIEHKVAAIIARPGPFPFFSLASGLLVVSWLYGACMRLRRVFYNQGVFASQRLPCFVISVGNLCLGGTGKTPMTLHLANSLRDMGYETVVLSRGYKGLCEKKGTVVSDGRTILSDARHAGDEPYLMANLLPAVPVVVGKDRVAAGQTALKRFQPDVLVLDDGFQHQRLQRDLNLLLLDCRNPFGNSFVLPRGALREPKSALSSADAVILTRCDNVEPANDFDLLKVISPRPVFRASHKSVLRTVLPAGQPVVPTLLAQPEPGQPDPLKGGRVFAFSGLAHNEAFWDALPKFGVQVDGTLGFKDHHPYDVADASRIARAAQLAGSDLLVTTDKDYVRLPPEVSFPLTLIVMGISIDFGKDQERWRRFIAQRAESKMGDRQ
jgi:tetraacyldisaccharide 4'-kinase